MDGEGNSRGRGRPSSFTSEVRAKLLEAIAEGATYKLACKYAGIDYSTFARWRQAALSGEAEQELCDFCNELDRVEAEAGMNALRAWKQQFPNDYRASRDFMLTRFRDDGYSRQETVDVRHSGRIEHDHQHKITPQIAYSDADRQKLRVLLWRPGDPDPPLLQAPNVVEGELIEREG